MSKQQGTTKMKGKQSILFEKPPYVISYSSVAGKKEGEGPLGKYFDVVEEDPMFGCKTWEEAESNLLKQAASMAINEASLTNQDIRYMVGGDLLGQLIATSFGIEELNIPLFGVYGACSTMGESMILGSILVEGAYADKVVAMTSSHFAGAEKQFRFPLAYGNQRPLSASWTVTGSGAVVISNTNNNSNKKPEDADIVITGVTPGKIVDYGLKDSMNMGAAMAPAAVDTIVRNLEDMNVEPNYYDKIVTGDLGYVGKDILVDMVKEKGYDISFNHMDCGIEMFDREQQDTHAGGSGCGCSAITLTGYLLDAMRRRELKRILFVPTGALLSTVSFNEGNSVPGIAHGVMLEAR